MVVFELFIKKYSGMLADCGKLLYGLSFYVPACKKGTPMTTVMKYISILTTLCLFTYCGKSADAPPSTTENSTPAGGAGTASVTDTTAPSSPTFFSVNPASSSAVNLGWVASTDNITSAANLVYEICLSTNSGGCGTFSATITSTAGATAYAYSGLTPVTTYYFRIRAKDQAGNFSSATSEQSATTQALGSVLPPSFSPAAGLYGSNQSVTLSTSTSGATICYSTSGVPSCNGSGGCAVGTAGTNVNISGGTTTLRGIACKASFTSSSVNSGVYTIDTTGPVAPSSPTVFIVNLAQYGFNWSAATDNVTASASLTYEICRSTTPGVCGSSWTTAYTTSAGAVNHTVTSLNPSTTYYFRIRAVDQVGNTGTPSAEINITTRTPIVPLWARSTTAGTDLSIFKSVATDASGNIYAVGFQRGNGSFSYGAGVSATGPTATNYHPILVKYGPNGNALWARTLVSGSVGGIFTGVTVDSTGNIIVAGSQHGNSAYTYGTGVSATSPFASGYNAVLIKYNPNGDALWATTLAAGADVSEFWAVRVDQSDNIYAGGYQAGAGNYTYGSITAAGSSSSISNYVLVKYNSSGTAQWVKTPTAGSVRSIFVDLAVHTDGSIIAVGTVHGTTSLTLAPGVTVAGSYFDGNLLTVKFDTTGTPLWARSVSSSTHQSNMSAVALDGSGNVYAVGTQFGNSGMNFGNSVVAGGPNSSSNPILVKYDTSGQAQWAKSVSGSNSSAYFSGVAISGGNIYVGGGQNSTNSFTYGNGVYLTGGASLSNPILIRYDSSGAPQYGVTSTEYSVKASFAKVAVDTTGKIVAVGAQNAPSSLGFSGTVYAAGSYSDSNESNPTIVKFE